MQRPTVSPAALLALGGGACVALSLPPWGFWPLAFAGIAAFEVALGEQPTRGQRARRGWLFGAGWLYMGMGWMWFLSAPGYLLAAAMFAGLHAAAAALAPTGAWRVLGRPLAHTAAESVRLFVPFGGVPLATLPIGQAGGPLLGVVRVGGVILLTWVVFQIGFALAGIIPAVLERTATKSAAPPRTSVVPRGIAGLAVVLLVAVVAAIAPDGRSWSDGPAPTMTVAAVQGGGLQGTRAIYTDSREVVDRHLEASATIAAGSVDLVLWPENVVDVPTFAGSVEIDEITAEAERIGAPFAVGITEDTTVGGVRGFLNAQVVVDVDGSVISRYDKVRRVPFGEYMPLRALLDALGAPTEQVPRDAVAGRGPAVMTLPDGSRVATVISWEVFFGSRARDGVSNGGTWIANPTNGSSYTGTVLQGQQVASSRLRAVEHGRWVVQASPTGFSAFITPDGAVRQRTGVSEQRVIVDTITLAEGRTWYSRTGDLPWLLLVVVALAVVLVATSRLTRPAE